MKEILRKRLQTLRNERDLTQQDLASGINITREALASYEAGYTTPPAEVLISLSRYFNVSLDYLLGQNDYRDFLLREQRYVHDLDLLKDYHRLSPVNKQKVADIIKILAGEPVRKPD